MKRIRLAAAAVAILLIVPHIIQAGQITYAIQDYAADQQGSTLSGSITTDGNLGTLTAADIISWRWTISHPGLPTVTDSGSTVLTIQGLVATNQQLLLPAPLPSFTAFDIGSNESLLLAYARPQSNPSVYEDQTGSLGGGDWLTFSPHMGGTDPWVIAEVTTAVPEPSSVVLLGLGITRLLSRVWSRSSRKPRG